ncbi:sulfotransferase family protein [Ruegeria marina]|uniref:Beta-1,4-N-acetylglucosamine oligosaccharide 6-O-sulfotransferase NodH n=1 Tax=Ruegeria marina TaxID=639004 RepID=A0A1G7E6X5_9RHOB|nr:sulfotransferase [Ruegeria marina]SDE59498.1 beta-1,4-N-acetylglucosamine oligosaccharide 6-O-sulfotransferase NodH [Ruegeria marina]
MTEKTGADRQTRFLIIGLPRSGTTYLMTLLNSHPRITCAGEQFNPYAIIGAREEDRTRPALLARDRAPRYFARQFFKEHAGGPHAAVGYKYMIGHNIRILSELPDQEDLKLIYVHRQNKLAQVASLIKADKSKRWAQVEADTHVSERIKAGTFQISQYWHEFETYDYLFSQWFEQLPHHRMAVEYREMFEPDFNARLCGFLGLDEDADMASPLVKQGSDTILDRFEDPEPIRAYFTALGRKGWLGREIGA